VWPEYCMCSDEGHLYRTSTSTIACVGRGCGDQTAEGKLNRALRCRKAPCTYTEDVSSWCSGHVWPACSSTTYTYNLYNLYIQPIHTTYTYNLYIQPIQPIQPYTHTTYTYNSVLLWCFPCTTSSGLSNWSIRYAHNLLSNCCPCTPSCLLRSRRAGATTTPAAHGFYR
jgi:hypothetical protein